MIAKIKFLPDCKYKKYNKFISIGNVLSQIIFIKSGFRFFSILLVTLGFSCVFSGVSGFELAWADHVVTTVNVGIRPMALEFNPSNNNIYVANQGSNSISVIDSSTNTVNTTVNVGISPMALEFNPSNNNIYVDQSRLKRASLL